MFKVWNEVYSESNILHSGTAHPWSSQIKQCTIQVSSS